MRHLRKQLTKELLHQEQRLLAYQARSQHLKTRCFHTIISNPVYLSGMLILAFAIGWRIAHRQPLRGILKTLWQTLMIATTTGLKKQMIRYVINRVT